MCHFFISSLFTVRILGPKPFKDAAKWHGNRDQNSVTPNYRELAWVSKVSPMPANYEANYPFPFICLFTEYNHQECLQEILKELLASPHSESNRFYKCAINGS